MHLRVVSYNVHKAVGSDRRHSPRRILEVLSEIDADIVALQEADMRFGDRRAAIPVELIERETPYVVVPVATSRGGIGWHGNALLLKRGGRTLGTTRVDLPTIEPRGAVVADLDIRGQRIRVGTMHLDLSGLRRAAQARSIVAACRRRPPMPTVLMGDLNEWSAAGGCLREFQRGFLLAPLGPSFHSRRPFARLDRIMHDAQLRLLACGVHRSACARTASDHLPVWADLALVPVDAD